MYDHGESCDVELPFPQRDKCNSRRERGEPVQRPGPGTSHHLFAQGGCADFGKQEDDESHKTDEESGSECSSSKVLPEIFIRSFERQIDGVPAERTAFRARALVSGALVGVFAATVLLLAEPHVRLALTTSAWAIPLHLATGISAVAAFAYLWLEQYRLARIAAAAQVALILWGWALAQYPYAIRPHLTLSASAAPENVLVLMLQVLAVGAVLLVPSLLYLFRIFGPRGHGAHGERNSQAH